MFTRLAILALLLSLICACDRGNGEDDSDPIVGTWSMEGNPMSMVIASDGTFTIEGADRDTHRCREAGFDEAVEACSTGRWEVSDDGYNLQLPAIDIASSAEPGQEEQVVECQCDFDSFPAELSGEALTLDMSSVGGPTFELTRSQ